MSDRKHPHELALALIQREGVWGLAKSDGCLCSSFEIQGISVSLSCHKPQAWDPKCPLDWTGALMRVTGGEEYENGRDLEAVAVEVGKQIVNAEWAKYTRLRVRYCSAEDDREHWCSYCHKPRAKPEGYLCKGCLRKKEGSFVGVPLRDTHDHSKLAGYVVAEGEDANPKESGMRLMKLTFKTVGQP